MRARKTKKHPALASALRDITVFSSPRDPHRGLLRCFTGTTPPFATHSSMADSLAIAQRPIFFATPAATIRRIHSRASRSEML